MSTGLRGSAATLVAVCFLVVCASAQYDAATSAALEKARQANTAGKYADAVKAFKEANKLQRNGCSACYRGLAAAYAALGDKSNADESAKKAVSTAKDAQERVSAHVRLGVVLMAFASADAKRLPAAEGELRQALAEDAGDPQIHYQLALALLRQKKDEEGIKELRTVLAGAPATELASAAQALVTNPRRAREWFAPQFEATTLQGQTVSLAALSGKVVVLDFWATWCPPCRESIPELKELTKRYPREKLALVSISADEEESAWKSFVARKGMDWPQIWDSDHRIADSFNIHAFPTYLVIDGEGVVQQKIEGMDPQQSVASRIKDVLRAMKELN